MVGIYDSDMSQLLMFTADSDAPGPDDLAGLLCGSGQIDQTGGSARVSVVVDASWRADAIAVMLEEAALRPVRDVSAEGHPSVRTLTTPDLLPLALQWTRGAVKQPPAQWVPSARALRMWVLAAGRPAQAGFELGLDPHASDSYVLLGTALMRAGVAATLVGVRGSQPALRISGHRRLRRLAESIGDPPEGQTAWPQY